MAKFAKSMKRTAAIEITAMREHGHESSARALKSVRKWLHRHEDAVPAERREQLQLALESSPALKTAHSMRQELARIWERSTLNTEQLVQQLKEWCERAEKSGVPQLEAFSRRLRSYA